MPLKAVTPEGKPVLSFLFKDSFQIRDRYPLLLCPHCQGKLAPRQGTNKSIRLHFFHVSRTAKCSSSLLHHPESPEHESAKIYAYEWLIPSLKKRKDMPSCSVEFEYALPHCGKNGRRADIALIHNGLPFYVVECQLAPITQELLTERMQDYREKGLCQGWVLGGDANTDENRRAVYKYGEFLGFVNITPIYSDPRDIADSIFEIGDDPGDLSGAA